MADEQRADALDQYLDGLVGNEPGTVASVDADIADVARRYVALGQLAVLEGTQGSEILRRFSEGQTNAEIGRALGISVRTVNLHLKESFRRFYGTDRSGAIAAFRGGRHPLNEGGIGTLRNAMKSSTQPRRTHSILRLGARGSPGIVAEATSTEHTLEAKAAVAFRETWRDVIAAVRSVCAEPDSENQTWAPNAFARIESSLHDLHGLSSMIELGRRQRRALTRLRRQISALKKGAGRYLSAMPADKLVKCRSLLAEAEAAIGTQWVGEPTTKPTASHAVAPIRVAIADFAPHTGIADRLSTVLGADDAIAVSAAVETNDAWFSLAAQHGVGVILIGTEWPDNSGIVFSTDVRRRFPSIATIVVAAAESDDELFAAIRAGASAYCGQDIEESKLIALIKRAATGEYVINEQLLDKPYVAARVLEQFRSATASELAPTSASAPLTDRELEILKKVSDGLTNAEIGYALGTSEQTVKNHVTSILRKLAVNDRTQAVVTALKRGWLSTDDHLVEDSGFISDEAEAASSGLRQVE